MARVKGAMMTRKRRNKILKLANLDKEPKLEGRHMSIFLSAKSSKTNK